MTLDGQKRELVPADLLIADERGAVAIAGVMGGATSEVSASTQKVLLETATFDPRSIRRTAKRLGIPSEASYRFERGVDANGIPFASARAASLLAKLGGGSLVRAQADRFPRPPAVVKVVLALSKLHRVTGTDYSLAFAFAAAHSPRHDLRGCGGQHSRDGAVLSPGHHHRRGSGRGSAAHGRARQSRGQEARRQQRQRACESRRTGRSRPLASGRGWASGNRDLGLRAEDASCHHQRQRCGRAFGPRSYPAQPDFGGLRSDAHLAASRSRRSTQTQSLAEA